MEKIYCWSGKNRTWTYWEFQTISLKLSELEKYVNEKGYCNIVVSKRKEADKFWNDLSVTISDYKPKETTKWDSISVEDIPF